MKKRTILNLILFAFILSFFVTPLGDYSKLWLNQVLATSPSILKESKQTKLATYVWTLKDADWNFFSFERSKGKVVVVTLWTSWRLPCLAELKSLQKAYDTYGEKVDFYMITNEERAPVEEFMALHGFTFPVTYRIIGEPSPMSLETTPASYVIAKDGRVVVHETGISKWDTSKTYALFETLLAE